MPVILTLYLVVAVSKIPYDKPALTIADQIQKLEGRGMIIADHTDAELKLRTLSYYRLSGYWHPFRIRGHNGVENQFRPGTQFSEIIKLYNFDSQLRTLILDAIESVEIAVRTRFAYQIGHTYGTFGHVHRNTFHIGFDHAEWIDKVRTDTERSQDIFIQHFQDNYEGFPDIPIWMLTEVISLGGLSHGFRGLNSDDKKSIAEYFQIHYRALVDWLHTLTYVRNICAHHSRLWNRQIAIRSGSIRDKRWQPPLTPRNDRIFFVLLMLRQLLKYSDVSQDNWKFKIESIMTEIEKNSQHLLSMGMTKEWKEHPLWKD